MANEPITVEARIGAPISKVWNCWTSPEHIVKWNAASDDWHCPSASNDLRVGGRLVSRMEARDGRVGFDFVATYTDVQPESLLVYEIEDGRSVTVSFESVDGGTLVKETFTPENTYPLEMQRAGWQSILDRFKAHAEGEA
jgi:uncharacterized protein YndB with AHSA1/START domain